MYQEKLAPFHNDDFRFVYIGPKNSWTPFHADVYRSYSWSANICGRKKWIFYPPNTEDKLRDRFGNLPFDVNVEKDENDRIVIMQERGEIIFVPTGWHHQVHNMEDTISVNHNWVNSYNIWQVWLFLKSELALVEREISNCRSGMNHQEWFSQCQLIMKANTGIDLATFYALLRNVAQLRGKALSLAQLLKFGHDTSLKQEKFAASCDNHHQLINKVLTKARDNINKFDDLQPVVDICSLLPVLVDFHKLLHTQIAQEAILLSKEIQQLLFQVVCALTHLLEN